MRWSYKTVLYELKKEGLLGSTFLDESEMEFSLNEYGKAGWELVSVLETLDGVVAVFKQPIGLDTAPFQSQKQKEDSTGRKRPEKESQHSFVSQEPPQSNQQATPPQEFEVVHYNIEEENELSTEGEDDDIGAIVIE